MTMQGGDPTDGPEGTESLDVTRSPNGGNGGNGGGNGGNGGGNGGYPSSPPWGDADPTDPAPEIQRRFGVRVLDPTTAIQFPGQQLRSTPYIANRLLVPYSLVSSADQFTRIGNVVGELGYRLTADERALGVAAYLAEQDVADVPVPVLISPRTDGLATPPNAWEIMQRLRAEDRQRFAGVSIDHLMVAIRPSSEAHPITEPAGRPGGGSSGYLMNGRTRMPVNVVFPQPPRQDVNDRRPVVAVLDTGCGHHDWLDDPNIVVRDLALDGVPIGRAPGEPDPDSLGDVVGPLDGGLDWIAGHGTFIAGVIRQVCPDAMIIPIPVITAEGVVPEGDFIRALGELLTLATRHVVSGGQEGQAVDVVSLSVGYYHETPQQAAQDAVLRNVIEGFGRLGIPVVVAAGNESTTRPTVPAVFTPVRGTYGSPDVVPVVSVGALNPDGSVALFSNSGDWITAWGPGGLIVSTLPPFRTGTEPLSEFPKQLPGDSPSARPRADVDPEDYTGGFGVWSGTSFSAPWIAAKIAAQLLTASECGDYPLGDSTRAAALVRGWDAVTQVTGIRSS